VDERRRLLGRLEGGAMANGRSMGFKHPEAFCLMQYRDEQTGVVEFLWNSRDGVTPFMVSTRDGRRPMLHVNWPEDYCLPSYVPQVGQRIFIDRTPESAAMNWRASLERNPARMADLWPGKSLDEVVAMQVAKERFDQGAPDVVTVAGPIDPVSYELALLNADPVVVGVRGVIHADILLTAHGAVRS
jgi:hypothetical protein